MQEVVHILTIKKNSQGKGLLEIQASPSGEKHKHPQRAVSGQRGVRVGGRGQTGPVGGITSLSRHFLTGTYGNATRFLSELIQILPSDSIDWDDHRGSPYWPPVDLAGLS